MSKECAALGLPTLGFSPNTAKLNCLSGELRLTGFQQWRLPRFVASRKLLDLPLNDSRKRDRKTAKLRSDLTVRVLLVIRYSGETWNTHKIVSQNFRPD